METFEYTIRYERGDEYTIIAPDEKTAFEILYRNHPECRTYDLLKVSKVPVA